MLEVGDQEIRAVFAGGPPIVCFAGDYYGDPTSKHHIMRLLAAHTPVLWVEAAGLRRPRLGNLLDLRRLADLVRRSAAGVRRDGAIGLHVVTPLGIPVPRRRAATRVNSWLYRRTVQRGLRALNLTETPLLWVYAPNAAPYIGSIPRAGLVYHCVDRWWAFSNHDATVMREYHAQLCRAADVVFASAAELLADCQEYTDRAYLIRHGVDWDHFAGAALAPPPRPPDIADLTGPIIGFFGLIHEWVDQDLLCRIAAAFPAATLLLIGRTRVDVSRLRQMPNVRFLGQRPYSVLPAYAAAFDVALVPFVFNDLTAAVNPIKLREYLSAGLPVVATALPEVLALSGATRLHPARTADEFIAAIGRVLASGGGREPAARVAAANELAPESWAGRCAEMAALVARHRPRP